MSRRKTETYEPKKTAPVKLVSCEDMCERKGEVREMVKRRAFEIYQAGGQRGGRALEDWTEAESQLLCAVPVGVMHSGNVIVVHVGAAGFEPEDLEACVEPQRLLISARKKTTPQGHGTHSKCPGEPRAREIFRAIDLSIRVDPRRAAVTFSNGVVEFIVPVETKVSGEQGSPKAA